ncbi:MAG TPA: ABC transporter ATP-binding protein [Gammaproteobacteria bacterium]|nr:ABC transporter ATP-binding protein [Gammaproteobacteria bacterium]
MFDLAVFANPARLKREFLATTEVGYQVMGPELQSEYDHIKEESPDILMGGNFWMDFIRTYKSHLSTLLCGRVMMTLLTLVAVLASAWILDESNTLTASLGFLLFYALVQIVLKVVNAWTSLYQSQLFVNTRTFVTLRVNVKLLRMGLLSSSDFSTGNLKTLISSDIYRIGELFHAVTRNGLPCLLGLILLGPVIVYNMGWSGVIAMVVAFGAMPLSFWLGKYVHKKEELIKKEEDDLSTIVGEWVTNVRLLRFLGWESLMRTRVAGHVRQLVVEATKQHGVNLINFGISVSWWLFPIIALIWANRLMGSQQDLVKLFASIWMLNHITLYIRWLPDIFISYAAASACVKRLNNLFRHKDIVDDLLPLTKENIASAKPVRLHFRQVSFQYDTADLPVLRNLNFTLVLNQHVSLIGNVGAGKSTLLKLICAELKPTSGCIEVEFDNGVITNLWHENVYHRLRQGIGYMPQEAYLSNTSLAVNVSLDTFHTEEDVMRAIRMAELEADIGHWAAGTAEEVGETGVNLSGGQKQRVNLARALYSGRPFLVLDDPLSAVDGDTEANLMRTLLTSPGGFLLCSHRLTELKQTDRLLVLESGKIIEDGDPDLLRRDRNSEFSRQLLAGELLQRGTADGA